MHFLSYDMRELNARLKQLVKAGHVGETRDMFDKMPQRDEITWTNVISAYLNAFDAFEALHLFLNMWIQPALRMDPFVLSLALKACGLNMNMYYGELLHGYSIKSNLLNSVFVGSALLDMYMKVGKIEQGCKVFDDMPVRNVVSWTTIITGLAHADGSRGACIGAFIRMEKSGVTPNEYTFAAVISDALILLELNGLAVTYLSERILYPQGGHAEEAFEYLSWMRRDGPKPNEFALASVLSVSGSMALLNQGKQVHAHVLSVGQEAIHLFERIPRVGLRPDSVTFIGVLSACNHAGLLDLDFYYFKSMQSDCQIISSKEHYGCIIDLLCRAGCLSDAEQMIRSMSFQCDDVVWSALLRASSKLVCCQREVDGSSETKEDYEVKGCD
ncbi:hypothetical protein FNV43_RR04336 [Rhamnella rubrinervis]|uniref:Pentatricopeptide repeat-containing protein n=1 Tax=Rhamnella rubrinervis TaxID=2594499 RepID=A0A8K0HK41_9ROSA|nr:hypothetical protein FNV43_RR04336 [Rhamnella rubrinervis]